MSSLKVDSAVPLGPSSAPALSLVHEAAGGPGTLGLPPTLAPGHLPATGLLLIVAPTTVREIVDELEDLAHPPVPAGFVLTDRFAGARAAADDQALGSLPPMLGFLEDLPALHARHRFRAALVCLPAEDTRSTRKTLAHLARLSIPTRTVQSRRDALLGHAPILTAAAAPSTAPAQPITQPSASIERQLDPAQLIGRHQAQIDREAIAAIITGKRVLITGAGGSIGSELARVCASFNPARLLLMERAENALFQIDHEMGRRHAATPRSAILHDVNDPDQTLRLLLQHRPQVVFHAAAHKHVPLMEDHPALAVGNNLFATKSIVDASIASGVERFVMISSDKAVNPTSVMGATKRLAELYIASLAKSSGGTRLSMVRFGNVLASACSVLPIWTQQIADGGPVTVTDPRMTRYFMTIPEAAALVVQAAALDQPASSAPVYVLDMGEPIRILDLAQRFVRLHGFAPRVRWTPQYAALIRNDPNSTTEPATEASDEHAPAMDVVFSGVRPGEKLFEQLAYAAEQLNPTAHAKINQWQSEATTSAEPGLGLRMVADLMPMRAPSAEKTAVLEAIRRWVPEMVG